MDWKRRLDAACVGFLRHPDLRHAAVPVGRGERAQRRTPTPGDQASPASRSTSRCTCKSLGATFSTSFSFVNVNAGPPTLAP